MKQQNEIDKYKRHNVVIGAYTYLCKLDKRTNKPLYKRKFNVSVDGERKTCVTKEWCTSVTKVNREVEKIKVKYHEKGFEQKYAKHLYEDIVEEYYKMEIQNCINNKRSFEIVEKFYSNNRNYVLNENYSNFKNRYVEDLTVFDIKQMKKDIITRAYEKGLSVLTVGHIFTNIDRVLRYCGEKMYIDNTLVDNVHIVPQGKKRNEVGINEILLKNEYDYFMKVFDKDFKFASNETSKQTEYRKRLYYTYLSCAFLLGFRRSEGFGMRWKDYKGATISIQMSLNTKNVKKHMKYESARLIDQKTRNSIREVKTPTSIQECLNEWKEYCESLGMDTSDDALIFVELNGSNLNPTTFRNRFRKIVDESGVEKKFNKKLNVHGFRHACCSFLIQMLRENNANIGMREITIKVGKYLGHKRGDMVEKVYGHLYPEEGEDELDMLLNTL